MPTQQQEPYVEIDEVAKFFSVSISTFRSWIRKGYVPPSAYLKFGNIYRFRISDVVNALSAYQDEEPTTEVVQEVEEEESPQLSFDFESADEDI